ncbi:MAG: DnaD domain protein [Agathobacter sp.]|nr:DnaD domain protein [Agathobacter sp.]
MTTIALSSEVLPDNTLVSNYFIDSIMPCSNGEFVKIYLYLLRAFGAHLPISLSGIADLFEQTEKDVIRALNYWEKNKLITLDRTSSGDISGIHLISPYGDHSSHNASGSSDAKGKESAPKQPRAKAVPPSEVTAERKSYTADEIMEFQKNPNISELVFIMETYLKHPLSSNDLNTVLFWYDVLGFGTDLIEYMVEYCISKGHSSIRYMDKVALGWKESGITTVARAREDAQAHSKVYYAVMKAFGITGRNLVADETNFIKKWSSEFAFDTELIAEACNRTMAAIHQPSFAYADKILTTWFDNKVHTIQDVEKLDTNFVNQKNVKATVNAVDSTPKNRFNNFEHRNYDYTEMEKMLLTTSVQS